MEDGSLLLSVVMPVYNEIGTIHQIVAKVQDVSLPKELIIVDDGSTDGTAEALRTFEKKDVRVFFHDRNRGKGAALRTGFEHVRGDIVLIQDADLEYDPRDYHTLLEPILEGKADVVFGSRFMGGPHRVLFFWHYVANRALTLLSNMLTNLNLSDMEVGYKVFRADVLRAIPLRSDRFGFEPEITAKVAKRGYRIFEVPIAYNGRKYAEGKKITWKDGLAAFYYIVRFGLVG